MRFAAVYTALVAVLVAAPAFAGLPDDCVHDHFYPEDTGGSRSFCTWYVCVGGGSSYRPVRECGEGNRCLDGQPTTCLDRSGNPF